MVEEYTENLIGGYGNKVISGLTEKGDFCTWIGIIDLENKKMANWEYDEKWMSQK